MQDNELDELFRSKLGGLEMQPSAHIWDNINATLGQEKKRPWLRTLSIAATLLVILSAGTWFMLDKPAKVEQGQVASRVKKTDAVQQIQPDTQVETPAKTEVEPVAAVTEPANNIAVVKRQPVVKHETANIPNTPGGVKETIVAAPQNNQTEQVLAAVPVNTMSNRVVPEVALTAKAIDTLPSALKTTSPVNPLAVTAQEPEKKKRRGIHSLGGLINAVVAKVDKREDKFIEFTETDEDNANITGINLGLFKVKKDK